jgi:hypothetical protein
MLGFVRQIRKAPVDPLRAKLASNGVVPARHARERALRDFDLHAAVHDRLAAGFDRALVVAAIARRRYDSGAIELVE